MYLLFLRVNLSHRTFVILCILRAPTMIKLVFVGKKYLNENFKLYSATLLHAIVLVKRTHLNPCLCNHTKNLERLVIFFHEKYRHVLIYSTSAMFLTLDKIICWSASYQEIIYL